MMPFNGLTKGFFILILVIVTWTFINALSPYFSTVLWSAILAVIFHPIKNKLQSVFGERNGLTSLLTIAIICLIVFIPIAIIISSLAIELNILYIKLQHNNTCFPEIFTKIFTYLPKLAKSFLAEHELNNTTQIQQRLSEIVLKVGQYLAGSAFLIGRGTFGFAVNFGIMLYLLFFLLRDGLHIIHQVLNLLPLSNLVKQHLSTKFVAVTRATIKGTVVVAVVQGALGGIAFYISGIDGSVLWGVLMAFLSLIPAVGSAVIWIPVAIYLFITHQMWQGLFIVIFFVMIVGLVDNFLRPILVSKDTKTPDYLILIATLGGIEVYGVNGFIIGPLSAALFIVCWNLLFNDSNIDVNDFDKTLIKNNKK